MSDFAAGANIEDKHYFGVNWERDLPLRRGRRPAQCRRRRPQPGRQGHPGDQARHRGRSYLPAWHQVQRSDEAERPDELGQAGQPDHGLLRHRRIPRGRRRHRAEP
ncbi:hypothetical protein ACPA9J_11650 [Pseudomonas aeruginosa]